MTLYQAHRFFLVAFVAGLLGACGGRTLLRPMPSDGGSGPEASTDLAARPDSARPADALADGATRDVADARRTDTAEVRMPDGGADAARDVATREARGDGAREAGSDLPAYLVGVELAPAAVTLGVGVPYGGFVVTALYSDGSSLDVTAEAVFSSADTSIAQVSGRTVTGIKAGVTTVKVQHYSQTASARVTVTASPLTSISIDGLVPVPVGQSILITATGVFADGTKQDVTAAATWAVFDSGLATAAFDSPTGKERITGVKAGLGAVTATVGGVAAKAPLTVTAAAMTRIDLTPTQPILQQGVVARFQATATYSDGTTGDVTLQAVWVSGSEAIARVLRGSAGVNVEAVSPGTTSITATVGTMQGSTTVTVTSPTLVSMVLAPATWTANVGGSQAFTATGTFSDGSKGDVTLAATWSSSASSIASVSNAATAKGQATALAAGAATITATLSGVSASASVTILASPLIGITISPNPLALVLGLRAQMVATGTYQDGTTQNLTSQVTWSVSDPSIITVSNAPGSAGQVTGVGVGSATVVAMLAGNGAKAMVNVSKAKLLSIAITPFGAKVTAGVQQAFVATGKFDDGTTPDLTAQATWTSSDLAVAQVSNAAGSNGVATSLLPGTTTITASFGGVSGTATLTVGDPLLVSLMISPATASIWVGNTQTFTVTAIYQNGTTAAVDGTWGSSDTGIATLAPRGPGRRVVATGVAEGTATITVQYQGQTATATLTVAAEVKLIGLTITPSEPPSLLAGTNMFFAANAVWNNGSTTTVTGAATWASSDTAIATVSNGGGGGGPAGRASGLSAGTVTITAAYEGFVAKVALVVRAPKITALDIVPGVATVQLGGTQQFEARVSFEDGTTTVVTNATNWTTSDPAIASITSGGAGRRGRATGLATGKVNVVASYEGFSATATLTVSAATPSKLVVTPAAPSIQVGQVMAFVATLVMSDNTTVVVTGQASWTSSNGEVATVVTAGGGAGGRGVGNAIALAVGQTAITASYEGLADSATLTVTDPPLAFVQVTPSNPSLPMQASMQFTATAVFTDNTTRNVTAIASWTTSSSDVALVSGGRVVAMAEGRATITATYEGLSGSSTLTVAASVLSIGVTPASPTAVLGVPVQFMATALLSNNATMPVTGSAAWVSSDDTIATITPTGVATPLSPGVVTITATYLGKSGTSTMTVSAAVLKEIAITPNPVPLLVGGSQPLVATGIYSDSTTHPLTGVVTWLSSAPAVAAVSNAAGSRGLLTALAAGTATVTAVFQGVTSAGDMVTVK